MSLLMNSSAAANQQKLLKELGSGAVGEEEAAANDAEVSPPLPLPGCLPLLPNVDTIHQHLSFCV